MTTNPTTTRDAAGQRGNPRRLLTRDDLLARPALAWYVQGFMHRNSVSLLTAHENSYKTFLLVGLAQSTLHGVDFLGRPVPGGDVLWIAGEGGSSLNQRLLAWEQYRSLSPSAAAGRLRVWDGPISFMKPGPVEALIEQVDGEKVSPELVVVDTVSAVLSGEDQNATGPATLVGEQANRLVEAFGAMVQLVHHANKKGDPANPRGSGALQASARSQQTMRKHGRNRVAFESVANNDAEPGDSILAEFVKVGTSGLLVPVEADEDAGDARNAGEADVVGELRAQVEEELHRRGGEPTTQSDLAAELHKRPKTVSFVLDTLAADQVSLVGVVGEGRGRRFVCRCDDHDPVIRS